MEEENPKKNFCNSCTYAKLNFRFYRCTANQTEVTASDTCNRYYRKPCDRCKAIHDTNELCEPAKWADYY